MGDQRFHVLDVGASAETAADRTRRVRLWLRDRGWTQPCEGLVDWRKPKDRQGNVIVADAAGPRLFRTAAEASSEGAQFPITVIDRWNVYDSGDAFEGFRCDACREVSDTALELALLGIGSCVVGAPSLAVLLDPAFLDQAGQQCENLSAVESGSRAHLFIGDPAIGCEGDHKGFEFRG